jgi:hypothetical protein
MIKTHYWVPYNKILDLDDDNEEIPMSQEANDINKVHVKFYCNSKGIEVKGLEKIRDLYQSSAEKSQDPV